MNRLFFEEWRDRRINKIFDILGRDWFAGKRVLELGACHGDFGVAMQKHGADVLFTDVRPNNLATIAKKYPYDHFTPDTMVLDQNKPYNLNKKFDLVLHMGTLSHIENWKQDLKCAMDHTPLMFLETMVVPEEGAPDGWYRGHVDEYNSSNAIQPLFTQESIEGVLTDIGCKFLRFDNKSLNTEWSWMYEGCMIRHVYDWTYDTIRTYQSIKVNPYTGLKNAPVVHARRMWMVMK